MTFVIFFMLSGFGGLGIHASEGGLVEGLTTLVGECIAVRHADACDKALVQTEVIQNQAERQRNYPCQTMVLGLGTEVVERRFNRNSSESVFSILKEVSYLCEEF